MIKEIALETARQLLNYAGAQASQDQAWEEQLEGAVALHNLLVREKFAYLADEVGMGKTYVALGTAALFRHFNPNWRVLIVAPRENIQAKWKKELLNFTAHNWRVTDNRVRTLNGTPAYGLAVCGGLIDLAREAALNPNRDFLLRMTSFSLALPDNSPERWRQKRDELLDEVRWLDPGLFDLRNKQTFKDNYARAINAILPKFDLVIIDEGHNLKHGLKPGGAYRNRLLAYALGHPEGKDQNFTQYGPRFDRVLVLSATPLESDYRELWNQLHLFGFNNALWDVLKDNNPEKEADKETATSSFLIRRLTNLTIGGQRWTKNMYRREWRNGGVGDYNDPLNMADDKQRLIVALVQKKVSEVIGSERFNHSFQIGMLASFESFLETAKAKTRETDEAALFDNADQADNQSERDGIDTPSINRLATSYYREFGQTLPHPKMDAVANSLKDDFATGTKTLIFVRRVRSVDELTEKLNRQYDLWLKERLLSELPSEVHTEFMTVFDKYETERAQSGAVRVQRTPRPNPLAPTIESTPFVGSFNDEDDEGGSENFFSWFFRGLKGPAGYLSGAAFKKNRLTSEGSAYSTFFEDNYVADLVGDADSVIGRLAQVSNFPESSAVSQELRQLAFNIFRSASRARTFPRKRVFWAYQEAALIWLAAHAHDPQLCEHVAIVRQERFGVRSNSMLEPGDEFPGPEEYLGTHTLFTELRHHSALRNALWPAETSGDYRTDFRRREQRRELFATAAQLGHPLIDLWVLAIRQLGTLRIGAQARIEGRAEELINDYLDLLEKQQTHGGYSSFRELSDIAQNFDLIVAVNFSTIRDAPLSQLPTIFGSALRKQTPIGGMAGGVNKTLVGQFRMPGYPLILVTTDVLQEGEDLHTFCQRVMHYGISWTPSAMEQRTGRVDRIRSLTQRRLDNQPSVMGEEKLQIFYPHLRDTVELLQVERVYDRMNRFVRLLHRSLADMQSGESSINTLTSFIQRPSEMEPIAEPLKTAFPIKKEWLLRDLPPEPLTAQVEVQKLTNHFQAMVAGLQAKFQIHPEPQRDPWTYFGTVYVLPSRQLATLGASLDATRQQPFTLFLRASGDGRTLLRCVSPVGVVERDDDTKIEQIWSTRQMVGTGKICAISNAKFDTYDLTTEMDILFHPATTQVAEVTDLVLRTATLADSLEQALLRGIDQPMDTFRGDLVRETDRD